ncbi:MAG: dynamin family protein [Polyangiaceae bacterium]|nr:dynamin family protein [Polyangiaceae bacterium]
MARLSDQLGDWLARVELLARGAEGERQEAVEALALDRPWEARDRARAILDEMPHSRVGLMLWADAAEAMLLDAEVVEALSALAELLPFRADVWLRLAEAERRSGRDPRASLERAARAEEPPDAADRARLLLADRDLAHGDPARAERWLDQLGIVARQGPDAALRRAEARLDAGDAGGARQAAKRLGLPGAMDGRAWLLRARLLADVDPEGAEAAFRRVLLLEAPGAEAPALDFIAGCRDADCVARFRALAEDLGRATSPEWRAAFASAEGRPEAALAALAEGADKDPSVVVRFALRAVELRDGAALARAVELAQQQGVELPVAAVALARALREPDVSAALSELDAADGDWADALRTELYCRWLPEDAAAEWRSLLEELGGVARALGALDTFFDLEAIAVDLERPLRVAIVGEFNAGKSSFINALLGEQVAPVGILPTTATLNRLAWAPDRFARIERHDAPDRMVPHAALGDTLKTLEPESVLRVTIFAPLELLKRVELIDTPGFNAPEAAHAETARAAFQEAHVAVWLLDAAQPLKDSERLRLDEIAALGVPLLVLLNKRDRLASDADVEAALAHVRAGLDGAGLALEHPPCALSARLALQGRAGDAAALEGSHWHEVEALVDAVLVEREAPLRERVLRGRAARLSARLAAEAEEHVERARVERERHAEQSRALADAAARVRSDRARVAAELEAVLEAALKTLAEDVSPVHGTEGERSARRFVSQRARNLLGTPIAARAIELLELSDAGARRRVETRLAPVVSALVAAISPVLQHPGTESASATETLIDIMVDEIAGAAEAAAGAEVVIATPPFLHRARALGKALRLNASRPTGVQPSARI